MNYYLECDEFVQFWAMLGMSVEGLAGLIDEVSPSVIVAVDSTAVQSKQEDQSRQNEKKVEIEVEQDTHVTMSSRRSFLGRLFLRG
jgi:hypothetical protein